MGLFTYAQLIDDEREVDESDEDDVELFEPREDVPKALKSAEQAVDLVASFVYGAVVLPQAVTRFWSGGTTGTKPRSSASCRVSSPSYVRSLSCLTGKRTVGLPVRRQRRVDPNQAIGGKP